MFEVAISPSWCPFHRGNLAALTTTSIRTVLPTTKTKRSNPQQQHARRTLRGEREKEREREREKDPKKEKMDSETRGKIKIERAIWQPDRGRAAAGGGAMRKRRREARAREKPMEKPHQRRARRLSRFSTAHCEQSTSRFLDFMCVCVVYLALLAYWLLVISWF